MGKLHSLRRAIERNPKEWFKRDYFTEDYWGKPRTVEAYWAFGARQRRGQWYPCKWYCKTYAYRAFVIHVLRRLGYDVR